MNVLYLSMIIFNSINLLNIYLARRVTYNPTILIFNPSAMSSQSADVGHALLWPLIYKLMVVIFSFMSVSFKVNNYEVRDECYLMVR